jgi:putative transposase
VFDVNVWPWVSINNVCVRESAQSWKELLLDLQRRGLAMGPELAVADGALS